MTRRRLPDRLLVGSTKTMNHSARIVGRCMCPGLALTFGLISLSRTWRRIVDIMKKWTARMVRKSKIFHGDMGRKHDEVWQATLRRTRTNFRKQSITTSKLLPTCHQLSP